MLFAAVENWKPVKGYEGAYEVSDQGRVRSLDRQIRIGNRFGPRKLTPDQIREIKESKATGVKATELARRFGVDLRYIYDALKLRTDHHITHSIAVRRGALIVPIKNSDGYPCVKLCKRSRSKVVRVHRLVAEAFVPNPHGLPEVNHRDFDKANNKVDNIEWCTRQGNIKHAFFGNRHYRPGRLK